MAKIKLTKTAVESAQPQAKDVELRDTVVPGFLCKITPTGRRVFMLQYRTNSGQPRKPSLGLYGELTVEQARVMAQDWLAEVRRGGDPGGAKAEDYEGCLVQIDGAKVTAPVVMYGEFEVDGALKVDDLFFVPNPGPKPAVDTTFTALVGQVTYSFDEFKLAPRSCADYQGWADCTDPVDPTADPTTDPTGGNVAATIYDIQMGMVPDKTYVDIKDVVVTSPFFTDAKMNGNFFMAETPGGEYSGIQVYIFADTAAELMKRFEFVVDHCQPAAVIVFDGSDAALSCGLVASRKGLPVLHVGAGLRSGAASDAADITRRLADQLSDVLYTTEAQANQQLAQEGVAAERIRFVGNTLADALQIALRSKLATPNPRERLGLPANLLNDRNGYGVVILDNAVNVGDRQVLAELINILRAVAHDVPLVWPMHSRTRELLAKFKLDAIVASERIATLPSQSYPSLVQLMSNSRVTLGAVPPALAPAAAADRPAGTPARSGRDAAGADDRRNCLRPAW